MNETLNFPLFDLCDAHLSALRGRRCGHWALDRGSHRRRLCDEESSWLMRLRGSN